MEQKVQGGLVPTTLILHHEEEVAQRPNEGYHRCLVLHPPFPKFQCY